MKPSKPSQKTENINKLLAEQVEYRPTLQEIYANQHTKNADTFSKYVIDLTKKLNSCTKHEYELVLPMPITNLIKYYMAWMVHDNTGAVANTLHIGHIEALIKCVQKHPIFFKKEKPYQIFDDLGWILEHLTTLDNKNKPLFMFEALLFNDFELVFCQTVDRQHLNLCIKYLDKMERALNAINIQKLSKKHILKSIVVIDETLKYLAKYRLQHDEDMGSYILALKLIERMSLKFYKAQLSREQPLYVGGDLAKDLLDDRYVDCLFKLARDSFEYLDNDQETVFYLSKMEHNLFTIMQKSKQNPKLLDELDIIKVGRYLYIKLVFLTQSMSIKDIKHVSTANTNLLSFYKTYDEKLPLDLEYHVLAALQCSLAYFIEAEDSLKSDLQLKLLNRSMQHFRYKMAKNSMGSSKELLALYEKQIRSMEHKNLEQRQVIFEKLHPSYIALLEKTGVFKVVTNDFDSILIKANPNKKHFYETHTYELIGIFKRLGIKIERLKSHNGFYLQSLSNHVADDLLVTLKRVNAEIGLLHTKLALKQIKTFLTQIKQEKQYQMEERYKQDLIKPLVEKPVKILQREPQQAQDLKEKTPIGKKENIRFMPNMKHISKNPPQPIKERVAIIPPLTVIDGVNTYGYFFQPYDERTKCFDPNAKGTWKSSDIEFK